MDFNEFYDDEPLEIIKISGVTSQLTIHNEKLEELASDDLFKQPSCISVMSKEDIYSVLKKQVYSVSKKLHVPPHSAITVLNICKFDLKFATKHSKAILKTNKISTSPTLSDNEIKQELDDIFIPFNNLEAHFDGNYVPIDFDQDSTEVYIRSFLPLTNTQRKNNNNSVFVVDDRIKFNNPFSEYIQSCLSSNGFTIKNSDGVFSATSDLTKNKIQTLDQLDRVPSYNESNCPQSKVVEIIAMGFNDDLARRALYLAKGQLDEAVKLIVDFPQKLEKSIECDCVELIFKYPILGNKPKVVSLLLGLYGSYHEIVKRIETKTIEWNSIAEIVNKVSEKQNSASGINTKKTTLVSSSTSITKENVSSSLVSSSDKQIPKSFVNSSFSSLKSISKERLIECTVCDEEYPSSKMFALECGHLFCASCWCEHISVHSDILSVFNISCMANDCHTLVGLNTLKAVLDEKKYGKILSFLLNEFVYKNKHFIWCCNPYSCRFGVYCEKLPKNTLEFLCKCNYRECFSCRNIAHMPASCRDYARWKKLEDSDLSSTLWVIQHTKKCPKCDVPIEKNEGCMHMRCKKCQHDFCWLCKKPWSKHGARTGGFYSCNRYNPEVDNEQTIQKESEKKYMHFYSRFAHHRDSLSTLINHVRSVNALKSDYEAQARSPRFLIDALRLLAASKFILLNSYIKGHFIESKAEIDLFSHIQTQIETTAENLLQRIVANQKHICSLDEETRIRQATKVTRKYVQNFIDAYSEEGKWRDNQNEIEPL